MTATAHQLRRRRAAADQIVTRVASSPLRRRFIAAAGLACSTRAEALHAAVAARADATRLLPLAEEIAGRATASAKQRRQRRRLPETRS